MNNWFEVGEEVLLQSKSFPQYNGEYTIIKIVSPGESIDDRLCNRKNRYKGTDVSYILSQPHANTEDFDFPVEIFWCPTALRKKHKPSDESFKSMMQNLKNSVRVVEGVV